MNYFYTIWFTIGVIAFWLNPEKHLKGIERVKHFLFCLFLGWSVLGDISKDLRKKERERKTKDEQ